MVFRSLAVLITALIASGCASTKAPMLESQYNYYAQQWLRPLRCAAAGAMSIPDAALSQQLVVNQMSLYAYNPDAFRSAVTVLQKTPEQIPVERCVELSTNAASARVLMANNQAEIEASNAELQRLMQNSQVNSTLCSKSGSQIMCISR